MIKCCLPSATVPMRKGAPILVKSFLISCCIAVPTKNVSTTYKKIKILTQDTK